jgi:processive 1,2-diacylglycerol beta-glucosyltransferase
MVNLCVSQTKLARLRSSWVLRSAQNDITNASQVRIFGLMKKRILILTASFGEGHNSAARGIRDGLTRVAPEGTEVELRDLFAEAYGPVNELVRKSYLALVNFAPRSWGAVYRWLDRKKDFDTEFARLSRLEEHFAALFERFQPDVMTCTFPAYTNVLRKIQKINGECSRPCKSVVVITDSITINASWYRCAADYFLVANEQSASVLRKAGIVPEKIKVFGFPVSPKFAESAGSNRVLPPANSERRILYMIHAATRGAPELAQRLAELGVDLTVTVGRADRLMPEIKAAAGGKATVIGWTDELPRMLLKSHLLIGKAGGATVQETIAAGCPMIINHVVAGQEEGNARLIVETNSGVIANSPREVIVQVQRAFADDARQWREWSANISKLSRPRAAFDIADFLLSI